LRTLTLLLESRFYRDASTNSATRALILLSFY
jgi:hypothetical protein